MNDFSAWKLVWVVTAPKYVPIGIVSAASFRIFNPKNRIEWIVTSDVQNLLNKLMPDWLGSNLETTIVEPRGESPVQVSRKIRLRIAETIKGDFAAVDADILCMRGLSLSPDEVDVIGACPNRENNGAWEEDHENLWSKKWFEEVGWPWVYGQRGSYLNAGLVFYKNSEKSLEFGRIWEHNRQVFLEKTGRHFDQPAFNKTAVDTGFVKTLDSKYNAPVYTLPRLAHDAFCFHYYVSDADEIQLRCTTIGFLAHKLLSSGRLDRQETKELLLKGFPFVGIGAHPMQYKLAGQWRPYIERILRDRWNQIRGK